MIRTRPSVVWASAAATIVVAAHALTPASAQTDPPDFAKPCQLTCVIYGVAPAAGVFWIDICNRTTGLIPGSPLSMNTAAARHPDSLYLGKGDGLYSWRIGSTDPAVPLGVEFPPGGVALTEDAYNVAYVGTGGSGDPRGNLHRVYPPGGAIGPGVHAPQYIGDLAFQYGPVTGSPLVGSTYPAPANVLVDVDLETGAQSGQRTMTDNTNLGGLAYDGSNHLWGEGRGTRLYAVNRATAALLFNMEISELIQDLASTPQCEIATLPTPPTPTLVPSVTPSPTSTPQPTATTLPQPVYLPISLRENCLDRTRHADVVLVLDTSTSMRAHTSVGRPKSAAALEAAAFFVNLLDLTPSETGDNDQVALVGFNDTAWIAEPLTANRAFLAAALEALPSREHEGTRLDLALERGREAVLGSGHRQQNKALLILLTDGLSNGVPTPGAGGSEDETVETAAALARALGVTIVTVGVGDPASVDPAGRINAELLAAVATRPDLFYQTPDAEALQSIYNDAAVGVILCPRGRHAWGEPWP